MFFMKSWKTANRFALALLAGGMLAGCASKPDIRTDTAPAAGLSGYKTFAYFNPAGTDKLRYTTLLSSHLKEATRAELEKHGYVYSETDPDLRVNFHFQVDDRQEFFTSAGSRASYGPGPWAYRYAAPDVHTVNYKQGTLTIEVVDARRHSVVWQGVAENSIEEKTLKNPGPAIASVVSQMFATYPDAGS